MRLPRLLAVLLAIALGLVTACGGDSHPHGKKSATPAIAALKPLWRASWARGLDVDQAYAAGGRLVVAADDQVVGVDARTGAKRWALTTPGLCDMTAPNAAGLVAVSFTHRGANGACRWLGVVNPATGRWLWVKQLTRPMEEPTYHPRTLAIGDKTVTVITVCCYSKVDRYDLRTGRRLATIDPDRTGWGGEAAIDGRLIAVVSAIEVHHNRDRLALYDADSGRELWHRTVIEAAEDNVVADLVSADPLILRTSDHGHEMMWRLDPATGRPEQPIGPQLMNVRPGEMTSFGVHDGAAVVADGQRLALSTGDSSLAAYDVTTGKERWSGFAGGGGFLGFDSHDSMIVLSGAGPLAEGGLVTRHQVSDPDKDYEVLGTVKTTSFAFEDVVGDLLLTGGDAGLTAYALPAPGQGQRLDVQLPKETWDQAFLDDEQIDAKRWRPGDIRPGRITTCQPSTATLRALGFHRLQIPMAGCEWREAQEPLGVERQLKVAYEVDGPLKGQPGNAVAQAHRSITTLSHHAPFGDGPVDLPAYVPVRGLGDEAYASTLDGPGSFGEVHLLVRVRNVVVQVDARGEADATDVAGGGTVATYALEEGALASTADVLREAGLSLRRPAGAADGHFGVLKPMCGSLDAIARTYVTGGVRLDERAADDSERRTAGCYWGSGDESLTRKDGVTEHHRYLKITAYAVTGSRIDGRTGAQLARAGIAWLRDSKRDSTTAIYYNKPAALDGIGDEAVLFRTSDWSTESKVVVRVDNLLIQVAYNDQADEDLTARDARATEIARQVAAAYT